jgi:hypothetical protein
VYPETGVRKSAAVVVIVLAILLSLPGFVHAQTSTSCACCKDAVGSARCDVWNDLVAGLDACNEQVGITFNTCTNRCNPADSVQGRCAFIRNCLDTCRGIKAQQDGGCSSRFRRQVRNQCPGALGAAKKSVRLCRRGRIAPCACTTATTVSTTSTPSSTAATPTVTTTTPAATGAAGGTLATMSDVTPEAGTTSSARACQSNCIGRILRACFRNCGLSCGVDFQARGICNQFCRNANCRFLQLTCTDNDQPQSGEYRACCSQFDNCLVDVDCVVTTTTTSSTSTTSTSSTTSSTSIFATTTTSTQIGASTTTSTTNPFPSG